MCRTSPKDTSGSLAATFLPPLKSATTCGQQWGEGDAGCHTGMGTLLLYQAGVRGCSTEMDATADHPWNCIRNPAHVCLRHKPCPSLCFKPVIRGSFLIAAERCRSSWNHHWAGGYKQQPQDQQEPLGQNCLIKRSGPEGQHQWPWDCVGFCQFK